MKADLAYIEDAAVKAVSQQLKTPVLSAPEIKYAENASRSFVAGLLVNDEAEVKQRIENGLKERRKKLAEFQNDREKAIKTLATLDIEPMAVIPASAWKRICDSAGLYMLSPNEKNEVRVAPEALYERFQNRAILGSLVFWIGLLVVATVVTGFYHFQGVVATSLDSSAVWDKVIVDSFIAAVVYIAGGYFFLLGMCMNAYPYIALYEWLLRWQAKYYDRTPHEKVLRDFLPNKRSPEMSDYSATIALPQPPQEVANVLVKAKGLPLEVAAVGEAIALAHPPSETLLKFTDRKVDELRATIRSLFDPIVFYPCGSAVAIIAQFGEFPVEKEAVDRALFSEHII